VKALNFTKNKVLKLDNTVKPDFSFTGLNQSTDVPEKNTRQFVSVQTHLPLRSPLPQSVIKTPTPAPLGT